MYIDTGNHIYIYLPSIHLSLENQLKKMLRYNEICYINEKAVILGNTKNQLKL